MSEQKQVNVNSAADAQSSLNVGLDADREIIADAMAFRALAQMPSLWQLTLMFGAPHFQMNIAWGTGAGIEVREYGIQENRTLALRKLIHKAQAEVMVSNVQANSAAPLLAQSGVAQRSES